MSDDEMNQTTSLCTRHLRRAPGRHFLPIDGRYVNTNSKSIDVAEAPAAVGAFVPVASRLGRREIAPCEHDWVRTLVVYDDPFTIQNSCGLDAYFSWSLLDKETLYI